MLRLELAHRAGSWDVEGWTAAEFAGAAIPENPNRFIAVVRVLPAMPAWGENPATPETRERAYINPDHVIAFYNLPDEES